MREARSPTSTIFLWRRFCQCTLPRIDPSLYSAWKCLFISKLIESCLWIKNKMMHITVMSTTLVRRLTNHHIVWKYAGHFVLDPYKKRDSVSLLINKHFQGLSREGNSGDQGYSNFTFNVFIVNKSSYK